MKDLNSRIRVGKMICDAFVNTSAKWGDVGLGGFNSCMCILTTGSLSNTVAGCEMLHSDTQSNWEAVPSRYITGGSLSDLSIAATDDDKVAKLGYVGPKRFVRFRVTPTTQDSTGGTVGVMSVLGDPGSIPVKPQRTAEVYSL